MRSPACSRRPRSRWSCSSPPAVTTTSRGRRRRPPRPRSGGAELEGTVIVLAATSLKGAFEDIEAAFEDEHPGVDVQVTTDGSANLATAIIEGAPGRRVRVGRRGEPAEGGRRGAGRRTTAARSSSPTSCRSSSARGTRSASTTSRTSPNPDVALSLCQEEVPVRQVRHAGVRGGRACPCRRPGRRTRCRASLTKVHARRGRRRPRVRHRRAGRRGTSRASTWPTTSRWWPPTLRRCSPKRRTPRPPRPSSPSSPARRPRTILEGYGFGLP